ncbi:MAG: hydroxymethylbilane synthase [Bacteroidetes bacterium]|nr:MAG: hydroxymethylbilane synthase [Bacteroidota bacterium]
MRNPLIIGTRGSDLALWQARHVQSLLAEIGLDSELKIIKTQGDKIQNLSFDKMEGKGFFTKEIEEALINEETDIAVHSHKDLPTEQTNGLIIAAVSSREDPAEILLIRKECLDQGQKFGLKKNAVAGTSSARRKAQLLAFRPDLTIKDLRGNVPTRINKLIAGDYDAILIAAAGIERLQPDLGHLHTERLDPREFVPAPAQGVLAIQVRQKDTDLIKHLNKINVKGSAVLTEIERTVLNMFHGGCQMPVGAYAEFDDEKEMYCLRLSKAEAWDKMPVSVYVESRDPMTLPVRAVEKVRHIKPCSVFISRNLNDTSYLKNVLEGNGFHLESRALIEMKEVPIKDLPDAKWIFFSSKHAVKFFFSQNPDVSNAKFACIGKSTAESLRKHGVRAEFIGNSADTRMTGKKFAAIAGRDKVLFPQAKDSLKTVQQQLVQKDQALDLVVYETLKKNSDVQPDADILVFTSPSNADAWFENYKLKEGQQCIAMGDATAKALNSHGVRMISKTDSFDEAGLARAVFNASARV